MDCVVLDYKFNLKSETADGVVRTLMGKISLQVVGVCVGQGNRLLMPENHELLDMRWWHWPQADIEREASLLLDEDVNEDVIARMRAVAKEIAG